MKIKDHGVREEMSTGSVRDTQLGKPMPALIPPSVLIKIANQYGGGADKYDDWNWTKGQPISRYMNSLGRHWLDFQSGMTDEPHLIALIWNAIVIDFTLDAIKAGLLPEELDDRHWCQKPDNIIGKMSLELIEENIQQAIDKSKE